MHVNINMRSGRRKNTGERTDIHHTAYALQKIKSCVPWMLLLAAHTSPVLARNDVYPDQRLTDTARIRLVGETSTRTCADIQLAQPNVASSVTAGGSASQTRTGGDVDHMTPVHPSIGDTTVRHDALWCDFTTMGGGWTFVEELAVPPVFTKKTESTLSIAQGAEWMLLHPDGGQKLRFALDRGISMLDVLNAVAEVGVERCVRELFGVSTLGR